MAKRIQRINQYLLTLKHGLGSNMFRQFFRFVAVVLLLTPSFYLSCADDYDRGKIEEACHSTVIIRGNKVDSQASNGSQDFVSFNGVGAGVFIDSRGYIITNYHVIEGIRTIQVSTYDGTEYEGQYISHDPVTDIAIIKIEPETPVTPITIGDSSKVEAFDPIAVIGHPCGYYYSRDRGTVNGLYREVPVTPTLKYNNMIQISAAINPGNSGGPLLNTRGQMIGINSALRQGVNLIAFTIPADFVMEVGSELLGKHANRFCHHGIRFKEVDVNLIGTPNVNVDDYKILAVESVEPDSPAEKAGLQPGDVLLEAGSLQLERKLDLHRSLIDKKDGDSLRLVLERDGKQYETNLALAGAQTPFGNRSMTVSASSKTTGRTVNTAADRASAFSPSARTENSTGDYVWKTFGLRGTAVSQEEFLRRTPNMEKVFDFEGAVQITEVRAGSIFEKLQIRKGDMLAGMITDKEAWNITHITDLKYLAERWTPEEMGAEVKIIVIRNQEQFVGTLPVNSSLATSNKTTTR